MAVERCPDCDHGKVVGAACLVCEGMARAGELSARHQAEWNLLEFCQEAPVARKAVAAARVLHCRQLVERVAAIDRDHRAFRAELAKGGGVALPWVTAEEKAS